MEGREEAGRGGGGRRDQSGWERWREGRKEKRREKEK